MKPETTAASPVQPSSPTPALAAAFAVALLLLLDVVSPAAPPAPSALAGGSVLLQSRTSGGGGGGVNGGGGAADGGASGSTTFAAETACLRELLVRASPPEPGRSVAARAEAKAFFVEHVRATEAANDRMDLGRVDVFLRPEGVTVPRALRAIVEAARCLPPFLALDVGANVGQTSLQMREELPAGTDIIAFEPGPANLEGLIAAANRAHFSDWRGGWRVIKAALTAPDLVPASGFGKFPRAAHVVGSLAASAQSSQGDLVDVVVSTLDVELARGAPNASSAESAAEAAAPIIMLKIDTEGFDAHVLRGAEATLTSRTVLGITFEYHWKWKDADPILSLFNAQRMLLDAGFMCFLATRHNLAPISGEWWHDAYELWTWSNVHCFPACSRVLQRVVALYNADRGDTDFGGEVCGA